MSSEHLRRSMSAVDSVVLTSRNRRAVRRLPAAVAAVSLLAVIESSAMAVADVRPALAAQSPAYTAGLIGTRQTTAAVSPADADGASYVPGSNVLRLADGRWRYLPEGGQPATVPAGDRDAEAQIADSRAWLASGTVPGRTPEEKATAARALLSMRLLTRPNGAVAAAWYGAWAYSWPRDSSFVAAALARTGHLTEAYEILGYNARTQRADGTWEARTKLDGSGPPDGRQWQLDGNGWVPWAVWQW